MTLKTSDSLFTPNLKASIKLEALRSEGCGKEVCGLILEDDTVIPLFNLSVRPEAEFICSEYIYKDQDGQKFTDDGRQIVATYHTHLAHDASLSPQDCLAMLDSKLDMVVVSCSLGRARWFRFQDPTFKVVEMCAL